MVFRNKDLGARGAHCCWDVTASGPFQQSKLGSKTFSLSLTHVRPHARMHTHTHTHMHTHTLTCNHTMSLHGCLQFQSNTRGFPFPIYLKFIFNWRIVALQSCVGFCHKLMWISHKYTYVPFIFNLPSTPFPYLELLSLTGASLFIVYLLIRPTLGEIK